MGVFFLLVVDRPLFWRKRWAMEPMYAVVKRLGKWVVTVVSAREIQAGIENKGMCDLWDLEGRMGLEVIAKSQNKVEGNK